MSPRDRHLIALILAFVLVPVAAHAQTPPPLEARIRQALAVPALAHAIVGVEVEEENGVVLFAQNAHTMLVTASNRKLFNAAAVYDCFGPLHRFSTELWHDGAFEGDTLRGDLIMRGGGDPSFGGRYWSDRDAIFAPFIAALRERGVKRIDGDIIGDVSAFDRTTVPYGWKSGYAGSSDGAPVDALAYNENVVGVVVENHDCRTFLTLTDPAFVPASNSLSCGSSGDPDVRPSGGNGLLAVGTVAREKSRFGPELVSMPDPARYATEALRDAILRAGIEISGRTRVEINRREWPHELMIIESPPIAQLLTIVLKNSQNLYAEMLLKDLSLGAPASYELSLAHERAFLAEQTKVDPAEVRFVDGSGLAPDDLATPVAIVKILRWLNDPLRREFFRGVLAAPASEGTLRKRLVELGSRFHGKTGTLNGVVALSGIVTMADGRTRYISILVNHHTAETSAVTQVVDSIVRAVAE
jgi:D-alanyl-D-alanine carboxypeptidase/D-alanyl-D-alanine-endopeptidase (penicillin-binding protein 4)